MMTAVKERLFFTIVYLVLDARCEQRNANRRFDCTDEHSKASLLIQSRLLTCQNEPQVVDVLLDVLEPTSKLVVSFNLYTQYFQTKNLLYGTSFEYCELLKNANTHINPVTRIALEMAKENFPQVLKSCPLHGLFNVTGLAVSGKLVPPYAPQGSYYFNLRASNKRNQTIIACTTEFHILQKPLFTRTLSMLG
uniref:MD-2-related lipid-recognition domain-containing protein n=1 Tax=Anopheles stephensi TaxID=30069 RepID=A0A182XWJ7_ANOST